MLYYMHELHRMSMAPARLAAEATKLIMKNPFNPVAATYLGRVMASAADVFEHQTRRYGKPDWVTEQTVIDGRAVAVAIDSPELPPEILERDPFLLPDQTAIVDLLRALLP